MGKKKAIVLSGGGARGAYQVGVLKALSELAQTHKIDPKINIYTGISAGAINAIFMASYADDFHGGVQQLVQLWSQLASRQVFASDLSHMGKIAFKWAGELSFGALIGTTPGRALLDTSPLQKLISDNVDFDRIQKNINNESLYAVALTATDYRTSDSITFVQGHKEVPSWNKIKRLSEKSILSTSHVMASSAIPLLFPSVPVDERYFGDGSVRNSSPCAPSIYLGADELLVVGVRLQATTQEDKRAWQSKGAPSAARVLNILLNAILLDGIEMDVERLLRMNQFVDQVPSEFQSKLNYRKIDAHLLSPTVDIGTLALEYSGNLPRIIRYLLKGLGKIEDASEITSYLLFDPQFCSELINVGYKDGLQNQEKLLNFLR